jgi:hypothetical protein
MSALHVWLMALGVGLAVGPIVLHLLLQEKPKRLPFPAFVLCWPNNNTLGDRFACGIGSY